VDLTPDCVFIGQTNPNTYHVVKHVSNNLSQLVVK